MKTNAKNVSRTSLFTKFQPHSYRVQSITFLVCPTTSQAKGSDGRGTVTLPFTTTFGQTLLAGGDVLGEVGRGIWSLAI